MIKKVLLAGIVLVLILFCGCDASDVSDQVVNVVQQENENVIAVKNGYPNAYPDQTYGEAFEDFFGSPTWKYFLGTQEGPDEDGDGEPDYVNENIDIVEFTGYCTYQDVEVKALIQFTLDKEANTFDATYLSFNEVPQSNLVLMGLIEAVFTNDEVELSEDSTENESSEQQNEEQSVADIPEQNDTEYKEPTPLTYDFTKDVEKGYLYAHVNGTIIDENGVDIPEYGNYTVLSSGEICKGNEILEGYTVDRDGRIVYEEPEIFYEFFVSEGRYYDFSNGSENIVYSVEIYNVTDTTFDFAIYEYDNLIFNHHTAEITSSCTGTYYGNQYTLHFSWLDPGTVSIKGFETVEGLDFINNAYYQAS